MAVYRRVCVVGGGLAGLGSIKSCLEEGLEPSCYEMQDNIGGLWRYKDDDIQERGCVMQCTIINTSKEMSSISDYPFPEHLPNYMHNSEVIKVIDEFADSFNMKKYIKFRHKVIEVRKAEDYQKTGRWRVRIKDLQNEKEFEEIFDAVMICTGHHVFPLEPKFPGQEKFKGRIIHSHSYKSSVGFEGRSVVVVGAGNSAVDAATDVCHVTRKDDTKTIGEDYFTRAKRFLRSKLEADNVELRFDAPCASDNIARNLQPTSCRIVRSDHVITSSTEKYAVSTLIVILSTRTGLWLTPRVSTFGLPSDINYLTRFWNFMFDIMPWNFSNWGMEALCNLRIDHEAYGLKPKHRYLAQHPTLNDALPDRILSGHIRIKGDIKEFTENGIIFENETTETPVDDVVLCTGYKVKFPFLDFKFENNKVELYKLVFPPDDPHPSMAFIGLFQPLGPGFPPGELQCRWVGRIFSGKSTLPPKHIMWADIKEYVEKTRKIFGPSPCHTLHLYYVNYLDEIANIIGCKPNFFKMFFTDPILFFYCVFGPCLPYQFRLSGPGAWKGARDAILTYKKRMYAPLKSSRITKKNESCCSKNIYKIFLMVLPILVYLFWFEYF
ncbi:hypothetical protein LAZ67_7001069 [Cordylochernes scorpioides]|uniref:Flavin-containing monooxygenase n=1 Tax=Cordylochernes scorpioides TaxID=51811 RepID=A0ABY6KLZ9_9ARAC|nr:hypothetical protein LAZ67_7001069 [Cordylochernes scorpioides]